MQIRAWHGPKNHGLAKPIFCLKFSDMARFKAAKVEARRSLPVNEMNAHYKQFLSCSVENLFLAKTSKLETREHWIQRITFTAETNAACNWFVAQRTRTQRDTTNHNTFAH